MTRRRTVFKIVVDFFACLILLTLLIIVITIVIVVIIIAYTNFIDVIFYSILLSNLSICRDRFTSRLLFHHLNLVIDLLNRRVLRVILRWEAA